MTHKDNLIPTPRTDKNGRTVIRHMKPSHLGVPSSVDIPAAVIGEERYDKIAESIDILSWACSKKTDSVAVAKFVSQMESKLPTYSKATIERIHEHYWSSAAALNFSNYFHAWDETTVNDYLAVSTATGLTEVEGVSIGIIESWVHYSGLHPENNEGDYPEERLSQLVALHQIVTYMDNDTDEDVDYWIDLNTGELVLYLKDDALREFVLHPEEPYRRGDIVAAVKNGALDVGRIKEMISNDVASLGSGVL